MRRSGLLMALIALMLLAFARIGWADPVSATGPIPPKIEELENAGALLMQGKFDEAYKLIVEAKKKYPALSPPRLMLFNMVKNKIDAKKSRPILELAAVEEPEHPEIYLTFASLALNEGRVNDTILNALKALEYANATRWTADQKAIYQKNARAALAASYESRAEWEKARTQYAAWLTLDPKNSQAHQKYGACLFQLDKPDEAFVEFQNAAKEDSTQLPATVWMALMYMRKNDPAKATEFFEKAVKQEAKNARVHVAYADFLLQQGNLEAAKLHTEEAAKSDPTNMDVRRMQGLVARYGRDNATATKVFTDIYAQFPADFHASNQLALILADMSDEASKKKALQYAEVNFRQYQDNSEALSTLGYCYLRNGDLANAQQAMQSLVKGMAGRPITLDTSYFLASVLAESKEGVEDAKKILKGAVDQSGIFFYKKEAKALLAKLEKDSPTKAENPSKDKDKPKGN